MQPVERTPCIDGTEAGPALYTDGSWRLRSGPPRYQIPPKFWEELGTAIRSSAPQNYARCDAVTRNRSLYEWTPNGCTLAAFDRLQACEMLRGRGLLMVGDSTVFQLWLSFVLLLGASVGKNIKKVCASPTCTPVCTSTHPPRTSHAGEHRKRNHRIGLRRLNAPRVRAQ